MINTYWVLPGQLMAGEFPGFESNVAEENLSGRLKWLLEAGVTFFIDLSARYPNRPQTYQSRLLDLAAECEREIKYAAIPTPLLRLPRKERIRFILELIDQALEEGNIVYIRDYHSACTEAILGCCFVRHGMSGMEALAELERVRRGSFEDRRRASAPGRARRLVRKRRD